MAKTKSDPVLFTFNKNAATSILDDLTRLKTNPDALVTAAGCYLAKAMHDVNYPDCDDGVRLAVCRTVAKYARLILDGEYDELLYPEVTVAVENDEPGKQVTVTVLEGRK